MKNPFKFLFSFQKKAEPVVEKTKKVLDVAQVLTLLTPTNIDDAVVALVQAYTERFSEVTKALNKLHPAALRACLDKFFRMFGLAFGPQGAIHYSALSDVEQLLWLARVPVLATNHDDWPKPLSWVPRAATMWTMPEEWPILAGNTLSDKPIPKRGEWFVKQGYMAITFENGLHVRMGFRPDDVDNYVNFTFITAKFVR